MPMRLGCKPKVGRRHSFDVDSSLEDRLSYTRLEEQTAGTSDMSPEGALRAQLENHISLHQQQWEVSDG
jgi:hypothetical protein